FFLLFYAFAVHLELRSFPTRRSSDLGRGSFPPRRPFPLSGVFPPIRQSCDTWLPSVCCKARIPSCPVRTRRNPSFAADGGKPCIDRKSTRLNSSHVKISYAVFCLKKK